MSSIKPTSPAHPGNIKVIDISKANKHTDNEAVTPADADECVIAQTDSKDDNHLDLITSVNWVKSDRSLKSNVTRSFYLWLFHRFHFLSTPFQFFFTPFFVSSSLLSLLLTFFFPSSSSSSFFSFLFFHFFSSSSFFSFFPFYISHHHLLQLITSSLDGSIVAWSLDPQAKQMTALEGWVFQSLVVLFVLLTLHDDVSAIVDNYVFLL